MSTLLIIYSICTLISLGLFIAFCFSKNARIEDHKLWQVITVVLLFIIFSPIVILVVTYIAIEGTCKRIYYRNRPRPIPKKFRKYLKNNLVVNEEGKTMTIDEYNELHKTSYTLRDVYGKRYHI